MNKREWLALSLRTLRDALPSEREVSTAVLALYSDALIDLPEDALTRAFARAARECRFFPVPADIRRLTGVQSEITLEQRAALAWDETREHARGKLGNGMHSVLFADPFAAATIRSVFGSWEAQCIEPDVARHRREWERVYVAKVRGGITDAECAPFIGDIAVNCRERGIALPAPVVAGSKLKPLESAPAAHRKAMDAHSGRLLGA